MEDLQTTTTETVVDTEEISSRTYTQADLDRILEEKIGELETKTEQKLNKIQNKIGYEQRKSKTIDYDNIDEIIDSRVDQKMQEKEILSKYPDIDMTVLKDTKAKHPTLSWEEVIMLQNNTQAYGMTGSANRNHQKQTYSKEEFAKLSDIQKADVIKKARQGEVVLS